MTLASQHPVVSTVTWTSPSLLSAVAYQITAPWDAQTSHWPPSRIDVGKRYARQSCGQPETHPGLLQGLTAVGKHCPRQLFLSRDPLQRHSRFRLSSFK